MTGLITDAGIEGKKRVDWNRDITRPAMSWVCAAHPKLRLQSILLASFFTGGVFGAFGLQRWGFVSCLLLGLPPVL
jgi:hypothetical protein